MEVMIVVVIIGILAALAYPNLEKYLKRARQTEAKTNLSAIYTAQKIYFTLHQSYADDINELDLSLAQGDLHIHYTGSIDKHLQSSSRRKY